MFAQQKKKYVSLGFLHKLSSGWVARYEIWSVGAEAMCTIDHKFSLDNNEVWLQLKQTMCQKEATSWDSGGWGMQFPISISKNARMFTVLRTLYSLKPAASKSGLILESSVLNINIDGVESPHWSSSNEGLVSDDALFKSSQLEADERFDRRDLYLYWFFFQRDSRSLLFVSQDLQTRSMAAIFEIQSSPELVTSVVNSGELKIKGSVLRHPSWCRNFNQVQVIYHPRSPLLGFSFAGRLYLWPYSNRKYLFLHPKNIAGRRLCLHYSCRKPLPYL